MSFFCTDDVRAPDTFLQLSWQPTVSINLADTYQNNWDDSKLASWSRKSRWLHVNEEILKEPRGASALAIIVRHQFEIVFKNT